MVFWQLFQLNQRSHLSWLYDNYRFLSGFDKDYLLNGIPIELDVRKNESSHLFSKSNYLNFF